MDLPCQPASLLSLVPNSESMRPRRSIKPQFRIAHLHDSQSSSLEQGETRGSYTLDFMQVAASSKHRGRYSSGFPRREIAEL